MLKTDEFNSDTGALTEEVGAMQARHASKDPISYAVVSAQQVKLSVHALRQARFQLLRVLLANQFASQVNSLSVIRAGLKLVNTGHCKTIDV